MITDDDMMKIVSQFTHKMIIKLNGKVIEVELSCEGFDDLQDVIKILKVYELLRMEELK